MFLLLSLPAVVSGFDVFEFPMNMAGFMSIERASNACEDRIHEAVEITLDEANVKCEEAIRENLVNIERKDDDMLLQVMEATRKQEELRCFNIVDEALANAALAFKDECESRIIKEKLVSDVCSLKPIITALFQIKENEEVAGCRVKTAAAVRTAVVRDRLESERVCRILLQEKRRADINHCNEITQVMNN